MERQKSLKNVEQKNLEAEEARFSMDNQRKLNKEEEKQRQRRLRRDSYKRELERQLVKKKMLKIVNCLKKT